MPLIQYEIQSLRNLALLLALLPSLAVAATAGQATLELIPVLAYVITFVSSALGGVAGTLHRMSKHMEPGAKGITHPKIFVAANLLGGFCAGWFSFLLGTHTDIAPLLVQGMVLLASFGGATVVERLIDRYFPMTAAPPPPPNQPSN